VRKLQDKIDLIRYSVGSDQSILDEEPIPQDFTEDLYSRDERKRLEAFRKIFETSELLAAEDLFMDDLREFDRNPEFGETYKEHIRHLPKGKWGHIQTRKPEETCTQLVHIMDASQQAGYFVAYGEGRGEMMTTAEGLLSIQTGCENNRRFRDDFLQKPRKEAELMAFIQSYQFREGDAANTYNRAQEVVIGYIKSLMFEYQYPYEDILLVENCLLYSLNAYLNKATSKLLKKVGGLQRQNKHVGSALIDELLGLARTYTPDTSGERAPLSEIVQIFE